MYVSLIFLNHFLPNGEAFVAKYVEGTNLRSYQKAKSQEFKRFGDFIADFISNPNDSNLNFTNIHLGQSTII